MRKTHRFIVVFLLGSCLSCAAVPDSPPADVTATLGSLAPTAAVATPRVTSTPSPTPTSTRIPPQYWRLWPVLPEVSDTARAIYAKGLALGNDPTHFSILGDCQSMPQLFMGRFVTDEDIFDALEPDLQRLVEIFSDSMLRKGPANYPGTTAGAVLWSGWMERTQITYCMENETPLDCELRVWNPSIIFINLGTHWEARNIDYMHKILDALVERGVVPILATKADNREGDERLNQETALLAYEYDIPLWNFWGAVQDLPNGGLREEQEVADIYLTDEGLEIHRVSGLQALQTVYSQLTQP